MNRRHFLGRLGLGIAGLVAGLPAAARTRELDRELLPDGLEAEVARFRAGLGFNGDAVHDERLNQAHLARGYSAPFAFAGLKGDRLCGNKASAACLTNPRLRRMLYSFNERSGAVGKSRQLNHDLRMLHARSGQFITRMRAYFGLDHAPGWIDRELAS